MVSLNGQSCLSARRETIFQLFNNSRDAAVAERGRIKHEKGNAFNGALSGKWYLFFTKLFGFTRPFYERALGEISLDGDLTVLDVGCGPGVLGFALAERLTPGSVVHGIDLAEDQIRYASERAANRPVPMHFTVGSMDELPFDDATIDLAITSMAMHEASRDVRPRAIAEIARVLKPGGRFLLVDWSKPKFGFWAAVWLPFLVCGENNRDNWRNAYNEYCRNNGLRLEEDAYINSITRRQLFQKQ